VAALGSSVDACRMHHDGNGALYMLIRLTTSGALRIALATCALVLQAQAQTSAQTPQPPAQAPAPPSGKTLASSAGLMVYPSNGQSADQQAQDEAQCFNWARDQSGYDPMNPPPTPAAPSTPGGSDDGDVERGALGGAAVGAAGGAIIGAIAGNAGKGAGIGAATGLLAGGMRAHDQEEQRDERARAQAQASREEQRAARQELANKFRRGMAVCLEARGYATK
jgi:Glycine-zipper domain